MNLTYTRVFTLCLCLCYILNLSGQSTCQTDEYLTERLKNDEKFALRFLDYEKNKLGGEYKSSLVCTGSNTVIIPVAVHYFSPIDCSNKQCLLDAAETQIAVMNENFAADNADLSYYTTELNGVCSSLYPLSRAPQVGIGTCVQFCLATKNHPANSGLSNGEPAITINQNTWPSAGGSWSGYLNIFVSDGTSAGQGSATLGISALPGNADGDGFWVNYTVFGGPNFSCDSGATINSNSNFDLGKTAVHEAGHYFGLYHVFQGSNCIVNDSDPPGPIPVNDTPTQDSPHYGCSNVTSCSNAPSSCSGGTDNFYSFMDYSNDDCMVMFTADQSQVINYWANFHTWSNNTTVCATVTADVNCNGPSCSDGILNGNESGVDCGGNLCVPCSYDCGDSFVDSGGVNDYLNNENVIWTVCSSGNNVVILNFSEFDIEEGGSTGCYDQLKVFDGPDVNATDLGAFCGVSIADAPGNGYLQSSGNCITFQFISDQSVVKNGWVANISCAPTVSCTDGIQNGDETGIDCGGSNCGACASGCNENFYDTGGSSSNYNNGEFNSFLYCPDNQNDDIIQVTFTWSDIEATSGNGNNGTGCWDMLRIYNGEDATAPMIGNYCGEESGDGDVPGLVQNNLYVGMIVQSANSSGCLYFTFESDNSVNESGWAADVDCIQASLPVNLTHFSVLKNRDQAQLFWETSVEINNDGFYIERSLGNNTFESMAFVKGKEYPTNNNVYEYVDKNLAPGKYYYRLKQVDLDGSYEYTNVVSVDIDRKEESSIAIYPNPTSDLVNLSFNLADSEKAISFKIYNKLGQMIEEIPISTERYFESQMNLAKYPRGTYIICLKTDVSTYLKQINKI